MAKAKKAVLIGIDSVPKWLLDEYVRRGHAPAIGRLIENGCYTEGRSYCPVETGTNWTVIATGAPPMVTEVNMGTHLVGSPLNETVRGFPSNLCKAEQLWNAAARGGKRSVIFDYPGCRPYNCPTAICVGEDGRPGRSCRAVQEPRGYIVAPTPLEIERFKVGFANEIRIERAEGWANLPPASGAALAATIPILPESVSEIRSAGELYALLLPESGGAYRSVEICAGRDRAARISVVRVDQWSGPLRHTFTTNLGPVEGYWRARLQELTPDAKRMRLYFTQIYPVREFATPAAIEERLLRELGPYIPHTCRQQTIHSGGADMWTFRDEVEQTVDWYCRAMEIVLGGEEWDLFMMKWHPTDFANHFGAFQIEPRHPQFEPAREEEGWAYHGAIMRHGDRLVETAMRLAGEEALVVVVSDHGAIAVPPGEGGHGPSLGQAFEKAGLLARKPDRTIDWSRTRAFPTGHYVYVNLAGRDPGGIVQPGEEYEQVRQMAIDIALDQKNPTTGRHSANLACRKEDAWMVGVGGERVGDVFLWSEERLPRKTTMREYLAAHPGAEFGTWEMPHYSSGAHTHDPFIVMAGPGVKKGYRRTLPVWLSAVAPTMALAADFPVPANAQGAAIWDFLAE
ncbi:MAG: alkaline phosphatase family protein [Candidatus Sumerlaeota bacterium]|nr:alkaline phosphatase family protein [Candidatus Sumerlaeota bacterium]